MCLWLRVWGVGFRGLGCLSFGLGCWVGGGLWCFVFVLGAWENMVLGGWVFLKWFLGVFFFFGGFLMVSGGFIRCFLRVFGSLQGVEFGGFATKIGKGRHVEDGEQVSARPVLSKHQVRSHDQFFHTVCLA